MKVSVICYVRNNSKEQIIKAIKILNNVQDYFQFVLEMNEEDVSKNEKINWNDFLERCTIFTDNYVICIVQKAFNDNWFLHQNNKFSIITTNAWEETYAPPSLIAFLIYEITQAIMGFILGMDEDRLLKLRHTKTVGCIYDFCKKKSEIKYGMAIGTICSRCKGVLFQFGIESDALSSIEKMLRYVRSETIGNTLILDINKVLIIMKCDKDENKRVYKFGIEAALKELNIECIKADKKINSSLLLLKVKDCIEKSQLIIVKVDSENLDEYFELGLAMGLDKDVLLISEQSLIIDLPSGLKNWGCLTYCKDDYEELKNKIINYYKENFIKIR